MNNSLYSAARFYRFHSLSGERTRCRTSLSAFLFSALLLTSCQQDEQQLQSDTDLVDVTITLSGLNITTEPTPVSEAPASGSTRASDKTASAAQLTNIDLTIFQGKNKYKTISQTTSTENFGTISLKLPVGTYSFVAVANDGSTASTIISTTSATAPENSRIYSCSQSVTISGNTTQSVSLDMGTRKNASFVADITDDTPSNVDALQYIISPSATAPTSITFDPSTGFTPSSWKYEKIFTKAAYNVDTFTGKKPSLYFLLPAAQSNLNVTINALSAEDAETHQRTVLYTRTLQNVTFKQAHQTTATGTFFSAAIAESFLFDTTLSGVSTSLD